jgi:hypothetical protein
MTKQLCKAVGHEAILEDKRILGHGMSRPYQEVLTARWTWLPPRVPLGLPLELHSLSTKRI